MDAALARKHTTRRRAIVEALAQKLENINGGPPFRSSVQNVERRLKFWDEVTEFPAIHIGAGTETREYDGGGFRFRFLRITVRCYVSDDTSSPCGVTISTSPRTGTKHERPPRRD